MSVSPSHWLFQRLAELTSQAEPIPPDAAVADLGLSSVVLVQLATEAQQRWGVEVEDTFFFDHPTVSQAAEALRALLPTAEG